MGKKGQWNRVCFCLCLLFVAVFGGEFFLAFGQACAGGVGGGTLEEVYKRLEQGERIIGPQDGHTPSEPTVYLTFDDGPSPLTEEVLDILKKERVQGTFFALGELARRRPETIRRIVREGHALGNHTYDHEYQKLYSDFSSFWEQIRRTEDVFEEIAGIKPKIVRAPGGTSGNFDAMYFYFLDQGGYRVYDWDIDSRDSSRRGVPAKEIAANVKKAPLKHQVIVLLHDGAGHRETVKALPEIIQYFKEKGYRFAPIDERVKPVMFRQSKPKWERKTDYAEFLRTLALVRSVREVHAPVQTAEPAPPLNVKFGQRVLTFDASEHLLRNDYFYVSLRKMAEKLGGTVHWDGMERAAYVRLGLNLYKFEMDQRKAEWSDPFFWGRPTSLSFIVHENRIYVPIRQAVEMLGGYVEGYTLEEKQRNVIVAGSSSLTEFFQVHYNKSYSVKGGFSKG